jgi:hypothetical protein
MISGTTTDAGGNYRLEDVPVGRYVLTATYVGYNPATVKDVVVNTGKQTVINLSLEESVTKMEEVVVMAGKRKGESLNEMAPVSARSFSVDESERYAGSRGDPARMEAHGQQALTLARQVGDEELIARCLNVLAYNARNQGQVQEALAYGEEALQCYRALEDRALQAD